MLCLLNLLFCALANAQETPSVRISEFLAGNATTQFRDGDGNREDWIELINSGDTAADIGGFFLSNRTDFLNQWKFPEGTMIPPGGYLVVFASGKGVPDGEANLHSNFRLRIEGEFLALVDSDGSTILDSFQPSYPRQVPDVSYGMGSQSDTLRYFAEPTPGAPNAQGFDGAVADTRFFDRPRILRRTLRSDHFDRNSGRQHSVYTRWN